MIAITEQSIQARKVGLFLKEKMLHNTVNTHILQKIKNIRMKVGQ